MMVTTEWRMDEQSRVTETANSSDSETRIKKHLCKTNSLKKIFCEGWLFAIPRNICRKVCALPEEAKAETETFNF